MPKLMQAIFAERVVVDRFTDQVHLHSVISQVNTPLPPPEVVTRARKEKKSLAGIGNVTLLCIWRRNDLRKSEPDRISRVEIVAPNGKTIGHAMQKVQMRSFLYVRNIFHFNVLPVEHEGAFTARISIKIGTRWIRAGEAYFDLLFVVPQTADAKQRLQ